MFSFQPDSASYASLLSKVLLSHKELNQTQKKASLFIPFVFLTFLFQFVKTMADHREFHPVDNLHVKTGATLSPRALGSPGEESRENS